MKERVSPMWQPRRPPRCLLPVRRQLVGALRCSHHGLVTKITINFRECQRWTKTVRTTYRKPGMFRVNHLPLSVLQQGIRRSVIGLPFAVLLAPLALLTVQGIAGQTYAAENSSNPMFWSPFVTNVAPTNAVSITDTTATNVLQRFYRTRQDL